MAFVAPAVAEALKSWWIRPKLSLEFILAPPSCHRTDLVYKSGLSSQFRDPVYLYRLSVRNTGKSQARRCECVLEGLDAVGPDATYQPFSWTTPVSLPWGSGYADFVDINPSRLFFCDLLKVPAERFQKFEAESGTRVNPPHSAAFPLGLILNLQSSFFSQPDRLPPGKYRLYVALFAENAAEVRLAVDVSWSGRWKDSESEFFLECVATPSRIPAKSTR